jgi:hypothetical protein
MAEEDADPEQLGGFLEQRSTVVRSDFGLKSSQMQ